MYPKAPDSVVKSVDQNCYRIDGSDSDRDGFASITAGEADCDDENKYSRLITP